jgi:hypothetical protein
MKAIHVQIGVGELADRLTILEIKHKNARSPAQRERLRREIGRLTRTRERVGLASPALDLEIARLRRINAGLWRIEDEIRACERRREFGARFIALARSVYKQNDRRASVKRRLDESHGSMVRDEKMYQAPRPSGRRQLQLT